MIINSPRSTVVKSKTKRSKKVPSRRSLPLWKKLLIRIYVRWVQMKLY